MGESPLPAGELKILVKGGTFSSGGENLTFFKAKNTIL